MLEHERGGVERIIAKARRQGVQTACSDVDVGESRVQPLPRDARQHLISFVQFAGLRHACSRVAESMLRVVFVRLIPLLHLLDERLPRAPPRPGPLRVPNGAPRHALCQTFCGAPHTLGVRRGRHRRRSFSLLRSAALPQRAGVARQRREERYRGLRRKGGSVAPLFARPAAPFDALARQAGAIPAPAGLPVGHGAYSDQLAASPAARRVVKRAARAGLRKRGVDERRGLEEARGPLAARNQAHLLWPALVVADVKHLDLVARRPRGPVCLRLPDQRARVPLPWRVQHLAAIRRAVRLRPARGELLRGGEAEGVARTVGERP